MPKLSIGLLTGNHYPRLGGMEFANHFLAIHLSKIRNTKIAVACNNLPEVPVSFSYPYPCYRSKKCSYLTPWLMKRNQSLMIKNECINLFHGPMLHGGGYLAMKWMIKTGIPFVAQSHGSDVQTVREINYGVTLNNQEKKKVSQVIKAASHIIAVSNINKADIIEQGANPENITVVHNGILYDEIQKIPFIDCRKKWGISEDDFLIITVGRNRPIKRMELLFQALNKLKEYSEIKCLCVGPQEGLVSLINCYNLNEKVFLTGRIPELDNYSENPPFPELVNCYRSANLFVSTSYVESFNSAASDALACGIPILVGSKHGVRDIIIEGANGWVMQKDTPDYLAEMILQIVKDRDKLLQKTNSIKQSVSWLTWDYVAHEMLKVYVKTIK